MSENQSYYRTHVELGKYYYVPTHGHRVYVADHIGAFAWKDTYRIKEWVPDRDAGSDADSEGYWEKETVTTYWVTEPLTGFSLGSGSNLREAVESARKTVAEVSIDEVSERIHGLYLEGVRTPEHRGTQLNLF